MSGHHEYHLEFLPEFGEPGYGERPEQECWHTIVVSLSETTCQCTGCLRVWDKEPGFVSDNPHQDSW